MAKYYSLDNVFDDVSEEYFSDILDDYLEHMPGTRESALEIINEMDSYDCWDLYKTLFEDFLEFLTKDELKAAVEKYNKTFDLSLLPLEAHLDESIIKSL